MFIPVVIDYALLKDVAVVALSARGECRAEVCRLVDVGKLATSWFLEVAVENTDHTVGLFSAVVREYPALFRNVRRFSTVVPALQADFALARNEKNSIIHPIEEGHGGGDRRVARHRTPGRDRCGVHTRAGAGAVVSGRKRGRRGVLGSGDGACHLGRKNAGSAHSHLLADRVQGAQRRREARWVQELPANVCQHRGIVLNELANDVAMYTRRNACWSGRERN